MSLECMLWAKKQKIENPAAKLLLMCLGDYVSNQNDYACWVGRKQLAEDTSMSPRSISTHLNFLEEQGLISREKRFRDDGSRTTDTIRLTMDQVQDPVGVSAKSARHEPVNKPTVSKETDVPSLSKRFWDEVIALIASAEGEATGKHRGLVGKWVKRSGQDYAGLLEILESAKAAGTQDPIPYFTKAVNDRWPEPVAPPDPSTFDEDHWTTVVNVAIRRREWSDAFGPPPGAKGCKVPKDLITQDLLDIFKPEGALV